MKVDDQCGHVVLRVALYCASNQSVDGFLRAHPRRQDCAEILGGKRFDEAVRTEHQSVTRLTRDPSVVQFDVWANTECPGENVTVRMNLGLLITELTSPDQVGDDGMVTGELFQAPERGSGRGASRPRGRRRLRRRR